MPERHVVLLLSVKLLACGPFASEQASSVSLETGLRFRMTKDRIREDAKFGGAVHIDIRSRPIVTKFWVGRAARTISTGQLKLVSQRVWMVASSHACRDRCM